MPRTNWPNEQRCNALVLGHIPGRRCANWARFKLPSGTRLCDTHAGAWALDEQRKLGQITEIDGPRGNVYGGSYLRGP